MRRARKITEKQIGILAGIYGVSTGYIKKAIEKCGADDDIDYLMNYIERIYGTSKDIREPLEDTSFAPLTKKDIAQLSKGYCFLKEDVIRLARQEKEDGTEPTREYMESFLEDLLIESAREA